MMSGIYFIVRSDIDECCIGYSNTFERDANLITKGLYDRKHEVRLLKTYDLIIAKALYHKIIEYMINVLKKPPTNGWFKISAWDIGYLYHIVEKYMETHHYIEINGKIEEFDVEDPLIVSNAQGNIAKN